MHDVQMPTWIDTHCHLDAPEFAPDRDAVRAAAQAAGVTHLVIPAVQRSHWQEVIALAHRHGDSYALGIHPLYTPGAQESDIAALRELLSQQRSDPHLVAVGEIGLDFFVPGLDEQRQIWFYEQQIRLAREFELPVILHVRKSSDRLLKTLRQHRVVGGIAHAFNGSAQQAQAFIDLGFKLGFGGAIAYERAPSCASWRPACRWRPWCWKPMLPIFRRTGSTPRPSSARPSSLRAQQLRRAAAHCRGDCAAARHGH
jgi:TatD DNase family protein